MRAPLTQTNSLFVHLPLTKRFSLGEHCPCMIRAQSNAYCTVLAKQKRMPGLRSAHVNLRRLCEIELDLSEEQAQKSAESPS